MVIDSMHGNRNGDFGGGIILCDAVNIKEVFARVKNIKCVCFLIDTHR